MIHTSRSGAQTLKKAAFLPETRPLVLQLGPLSVSEPEPLAVPPGSGSAGSTRPPHVHLVETASMLLLREY